MSGFNRGGAGNRLAPNIQDAALAAAEKEAFQDSDTWDVLSDDEDSLLRQAASFSYGYAVPEAVSMAKQREGGGPPLLKVDTGHEPGPSKRQAAYSGSGKGFWDFPTGGKTPVSSPTQQTRPKSASQRSPSTPLNGAVGAGAMPRSIPEAAGPLTKAIDSGRSKPSLRKEDCLRSIRDSYEDLLDDPLSALARLKITTEAQERKPSPPSTLVTNPNPLPWEAVLPPDLVAAPAAPSLPPSPISFSPNGSNSGRSTDPTAPFASTSTGQSRSGPEPVYLSEKARRRLQSFISCLSSPTVSISDLRKLSWSGIPDSLRPIAWQLLLGYLPAPGGDRRKTVLKRKRQEYANAVKAAFGQDEKDLDSAIWHQIRIDVPRTNSLVPLWQYDATQRSLERILYVWAIRHPASGYVQGINDLVTPFFQVFLSSYISSDPELFDVSTLPVEVVEAIEADSFWCLSKLLDGIQDNYIFAQPGIQRQVKRMKELCRRVDAPLYQHLEDQNVEFIQFAFRWMNCLLMRELSTKNIIRMWDTYLSEGTSAFSEFHLYVCLAFLVRWSEQLRSMDFQNIIIFLQSLPTVDWSEENTELLLSEAFMWSSLFQNASGHFLQK